VKICSKNRSFRVVLITDKTKELNNLILKTVIKCLLRSAGNLMVMQLFTICGTILKEKPDAVLFNLQF
jgi:hypothetical protein